MIYFYAEHMKLRFCARLNIEEGWGLVLDKLALNPYVEILTPIMMVFGVRALGSD